MGATMGKKKMTGGKRGKGGGREAHPSKSRPPKKAETLLLAAQEKLAQGDVEEAGRGARKALRLLEQGGGDVKSMLPALSLLAEIKLEQGDAEQAKTLFLRAVELDPDGEVPEYSGGGVEKFLWLAQLSEEGGADSVKWFERGCEVLRRQIGRLDDGQQVRQQSNNIHTPLQEKRRKLAQALCGIVEIYMTDLSFENDAEKKCERTIAEAMLVAPPDSPEVLQTLANVRISQGRIPEATEALATSMAIWQDRPENDERTPDFPTRISLARLLMEVALLQEALSVIERLVQEDDQSVEAWYLGGWCLHLLGSESAPIEDNAAQMNGHANGEKEAETIKQEALIASRVWLKQSLSLYDLTEYEDERLQQHARELVEQLDQMLGSEESDRVEDDGVAEDDGQDWESDEDGKDEDMGGT